MAMGDKGLTKKENLLLELDTRMVDVWEFFDDSEFRPIDQDRIVQLLRFAFAQGYHNAIKDDGALLKDSGYTLSGMSKG